MAGQRGVPEEYAHLYQGVSPRPPPPPPSFVGLAGGGADRLHSMDKRARKAYEAPRPLFPLSPCFGTPKMVYVFPSWRSLRPDTFAAASVSAETRLFLSLRLAPTRLAQRQNELRLLGRPSLVVRLNVGSHCSNLPLCSTETTTATQQTRGFFGLFWCHWTKDK